MQATDLVLGQGEGPGVFSGSALWVRRGCTLQATPTPAGLLCCLALALLVSVAGSGFNIWAKAPPCSDSLQPPCPLGLRPQPHLRRHAGGQMAASAKLDSGKIHLAWFSVLDRDLGRFGRRRRGTVSCSLHTAAPGGQGSWETRKSCPSQTPVSGQDVTAGTGTRGPREDPDPETSRLMAFGLFCAKAESGALKRHL